ncbi:unnamed protein product, partial [marine sediment metagenome]
MVSKLEDTAKSGVYGNPSLEQAAIYYNTADGGQPYLAGRNSYLSQTLPFLGYRHQVTDAKPLGKGRLHGLERRGKLLSGEKGDVYRDGTGAFLPIETG